MLAVAAGLIALGKYAQTPPARYQGDAVAVVNFVAPDKVDAACRALGSVGDARIRGCVRSGIMVLPNPCAWPNRSDMRDLACHELAHANRWPADHPK